MGKVHETRLNDNGDTADLLDGQPFTAGEVIRCRWPDGSTTEERVDLFRIEMPATDYGTHIAPPYTRDLLLLRCRFRGQRITLRPALGDCNVERGPAARRVTLTREEAHELLTDAAHILKWRLGCGIQGDEVAWTAHQLAEYDRGPVWMHRQAREYRRTRILLSRETGGNGCNVRSFNVRASLFVAAVLRACAAGCP